MVWRIGGVGGCWGLTRKRDFWYFFLGCLSLVSILLFVWHAELYMGMIMLECSYNVQGFFSNGFFSFDAVVVYHVLMYFMFVVVGLFVVWSFCRMRGRR